MLQNDQHAVQISRYMHDLANDYNYVDITEPQLVSAFNSHSSVIYTIYSVLLARNSFKNCSCGIEIACISLYIHFLRNDGQNRGGNIVNIFNCM